ncbi:MAG: LysR family transcriptional regulator [Saccharospirillaceae bacterium]|nr:LysR family transcriptional regulator [Pseudomonadales bacterium]NRB77520.1 LysR family transcriptional regulator [Saccharospirillaceae bacterium]
MEHRQLFANMNAFIAVANTGSFSAAAKQLKLSQPSISRMVSELETQLGVRLLQRSTRKLSLTEAGVIYFEKAQKIQLDVIEAKQSVNAFKQTPSGTLRIGVPLHWVDLFIAPFISEFLDTYPDIQLEIVATDQHQDIVEDSLDVVLRVGDPKHVTYIAVPIKPVKLQLCASPSYLEKFGTPKTITQLNNHNCLTYAGMNHWQYLENNNLQQIKVSGNLDSNLVTVLISSAIQGLGVILLPDLILTTQIKNNELTVVMEKQSWSIKHTTIENMYVLYSDRKHLAAKTRVFIDFFKEKIIEN